MSLLHRAPSTEFSTRRASLSSTPRDTSPDPLLTTSPPRLSYNPLSDTKPAFDELLPSTTFSRAQRIAQVCAAVLYCLFAAGIVFGYAALKPVLIAEGVYRSACTPHEQAAGSVCSKQELKLNFMFTVAAVSTNVAALPIGTLLDRYGPRVASLLGCLFLAAGALCLAFAHPAASPVDLYIPGYLFLALGGPFVFISAFHLSNAFPAHSGSILALLTGAFDSSSALFLLYRLAYQARPELFTPRAFFAAYLVVPAAIALLQLTLMPARSYQTHDEPPAAAATDTDPLLGGTPHDVAGALHHLPASAQLKTPWFALITAFTVVQMTRINFFVATVRPQYSHLLSPARATQLNTFFDTALPVGGVLATPVVGLLLDRLRTATVLALLVVLATLIGGLGLVRDTSAATANIALFVLYRPFYYTAVSDYAAKVFGFETFGKVYGLIICLAGLGNFSQSALDRVTWERFGGDYRPVNAGLLGAGVLVGGALVGFVGWEGRRRRGVRLEEEEEG